MKEMNYKKLKLIKEPEQEDGITQIHEQDVIQLQQTIGSNTSVLSTKWGSIAQIRSTGEFAGKALYLSGNAGINWHLGRDNEGELILVATRK